MNFRLFCLHGGAVPHQLCFIRVCHFYFTVNFRGSKGKAGRVRSIGHIFLHQSVIKLLCQFRFDLTAKAGVIIGGKIHGGSENAPCHHMGNNLIQFVGNLICHRLLRIRLPRLPRILLRRQRCFRRLRLFAFFRRHFRFLRFLYEVIAFTESNAGFDGIRRGFGGTRSQKERCCRDHGERQRGNQCRAQRQSASWFFHRVHPILSLCDFAHIFFDSAHDAAI